MKMLHTPYSAQYAFVGIGSHALQNLYPIIQHLGLHLKYICCKSPDKLALIEQRFGVTATTSLQTILEDGDVKGVFVCTSPQSHYDICSRIIASGKHVFVEKPPCATLAQLEKLIAEDKHQRCTAGMQKRCSPLTQTLMKHLKRTDTASYALTFHTGAYPEGDAFTDLFIHPVDLALYLFGKGEIRASLLTERNGAITVQALLSHGATNGIVELSTDYSWANPTEWLSINTSEGEYRLEQMERLSLFPRSKKALGIPLEKIGLHKTTEITLMQRSNFNPLIVNNQLYTQGFYSEIRAFAEMVEHGANNVAPLSSLLPAYEMLEEMKKR